MKDKEKKKCYIHNIFKEILNNKLLQIVIDVKKIILVIGLN